MSLTLSPMIHAGGTQFGLVSDNRQDLDSILIKAVKKMNEIEQTAPALEMFDRQAEKDAQAAVDAAHNAVAQAEATKAAALRTGDFRKLDGADIAVSKAKENLARAEKLRGTLQANLDQREAAAKAAHNAAARDRRKVLKADMTAEQETELADFFERHGETITRFLVRRHQLQILDERISADAHAAIFEAAEIARQNEKIWTPPEPRPEDSLPRVEPREPSFSNHASQCSDLSCGGNLCVESTGMAGGTKVVCDRCGAEQKDHPILAETV